MRFAEKSDVIRFRTPLLYAARNLYVHATVA